MQKCFSVVKSRVKNFLNEYTWRTAPQRVLAKRMTVLYWSWRSLGRHFIYYLFGFIYYLFGSWCRVQPPRRWLASNSDTTWLDCSWHTSVAQRLVVSTKNTHPLLARCGQGSHRDQHLPSPLQQKCVGLFHP